MIDDKYYRRERPRGRRENRGYDRNGHRGGNGRSGSGQTNPFGLSIDPLALGEAVLRRWYWLLLAGLFVGASVYVVTHHFWRDSYTASVQLMRFENLNSTEFYKPRQLTDHTFASLLKAPELIQRISEKAQPRTTPYGLSARVTVSPGKESDIVTIMVDGKNLQETVQLANLYANEAEKYTREIQQKEASEANEKLKAQLSLTDAELATNAQALNSLPSSAVKAARPSGTDKLQMAYDDLVVLQTKYTDVHPLVIQKLREIERLKVQGESQKVTPVQPGAKPRVGEKNSEIIASEAQGLANTRVTLAARQREAQMFTTNAPGYCNLFAPATDRDVSVKKSQPKVIFMTVIGGLAGFMGALVIVLLAALMDSRLKGSRDVERVTDLPILATLGNLNDMSPSEQRSWAFRTWTAIQGKLSSSPNHGLVCGITSANKKEGRSTWVNMLAQAASECGFRVLTVATLQPNDPDPKARLSGGNGKPRPMLEQGVDAHQETTAVAASVLSSPAEVTDQLTGDDPQPMVHIPLPGWVWNLERRKQWQSALNQWRSIENIVILVELPPASEPESVLLAQNLPNLIWLSDSGTVHAGPTKEQLQTLRDARCNLVGSVVNHAPDPGLKDRFSRWTTVFALSLCFGLAATAQAAEVVVADEQAGDGALAQAQPAVQRAIAAGVVETNLSFSGTKPAKRANWQRRFTLGSGDVLNFGFYGQPELARNEVLIGPDGRVSYLQAQDIMAAGLTVDELRTNVDQALGTFYRSPHTIITPVAYNSKKYYVLGKVMTRGVFPLDRPITVVEAVARAKGLETGILDSQNSIDLVDLQRSFLMREGKRVPVNLEALFQQGDLSQNVGIEPEDYLYFAAGVLKEVYVLGEVRNPGPLTHTENTTVVGAIASKGGFTDRAYKRHVLVVRGSLNSPQTYVVNTLATVDARGLDFKLQPKDIVYVSWRPFIKAEELLDLAATAFIQSTVAAWAGKNIHPLITSPFLPSL